MKNFKTLFAFLLILGLLFSFAACEETPRCWRCHEDADLEYRYDNYCAECFYDDAYRCINCGEYFLIEHGGRCAMVNYYDSCYLCEDCCASNHSDECSYCGEKMNWQNVIDLKNVTVCTSCIHNLIDSDFISSEDLEHILEKGFEQEEKWDAESVGLIEAPNRNRSNQ